MKFEISSTRWTKFSFIFFSKFEDCNVVLYVCDSWSIVLHLELRVERRAIGADRRFSQETRNEQVGLGVRF